MVFILPGQNKRQKNKRKRNRKGKGPQAFSPTNPPEPTSLAQPADSSVVFLHLLAVEHAEPRRGHHDGQAVHASSPSLSPRQGNPLEAPRQFPLSLDLLPLSLSRSSANSREPTGAPPWSPVAPLLLRRYHLVQDARRRRLHRRVQAIEARSPEHVVLFAEPPQNRKSSSSIPPRPKLLRPPRLLHHTQGEAPPFSPLPARELVSEITNATVHLLRPPP